MSDCSYRLQSRVKAQPTQLFTEDDMRLSLERKPGVNHESDQLKGLSIDRRRARLAESWNNSNRMTE